MTIIDAHQHFWTLTRSDYDWLTSDLGTLFQDFMPHDFLAIAEQNNITGTILIQAAPTVAETQFMLELAEQHDFIKGVVGWVDIADDNSIDILKQLAKKP